MKNLQPVILAAGHALRFGSNKILQKLPNNLPIIRHIAETVLEAAFVFPPVIVTRVDDHLLQAALAGLEIQYVDNPDAHLGISTSLQKGLRHLASGADAALIVLGDQPFITAALLQKLNGLYQESGAQIVYPQVGGRRSNPVILDRSVFPAAMALRGDTGAKSLPPGFTIATLDWLDARLPLDADTPQDYERILAAWSAGTKSTH
ncbi:MAG: nucleotidyltransferase family protein [Anaerolineaceae bacterium]